MSRSASIPRFGVRRPDPEGGGGVCPDHESPERIVGVDPIEDVLDAEGLRRLGLGRRGGREFPGRRRRRGRRRVEPPPPSGLVAKQRHLGDGVGEVPPVG